MEFRRHRLLRRHNGTTTTARAVSSRENNRWKSRRGRTSWTDWCSWPAVQDNPRHADGSAAAGILDGIPARRLRLSRAALRQEARSDTTKYIRGLGRYNQGRDSYRSCRHAGLRLELRQLPVHNREQWLSKWAKPLDLGSAARASTCGLQRRLSRRCAFRERRKGRWSWCKKYITQWKIMPGRPRERNNGPDGPLAVRRMRSSTYAQL